MGEAAPDPGTTSELRGEATPAREEPALPKHRLRAAIWAGLWVGGATSFGFGLIEGLAGNSASAPPGALLWLLITLGLAVAYAHPRRARYGATTRVLLTLASGITLGAGVVVLGVATWESELYRPYRPWALAADGLALWLIAAWRSRKLPRTRAEREQRLEARLLRKVRRFEQRWLADPAQGPAIEPERAALRKDVVGPARWELLGDGAPVAAAEVETEGLAAMVRVTWGESTLLWEEAREGQPSLVGGAVGPVLPWLPAAPSPWIATVGDVVTVQLPKNADVSSELERRTGSGDWDELRLRRGERASFALTQDEPPLMVAVEAGAPGKRTPRTLGLEPRLALAFALSLAVLVVPVSLRRDRPPEPGIDRDTLYLIQSFLREADYRELEEREAAGEPSKWLTNEHGYERWRHDWEDGAVFSQTLARSTLGPAWGCGLGLFFWEFPPVTRSAPCLLGDCSDGLFAPELPGSCPDFQPPAAVELTEPASLPGPGVDYAAYRVVPWKLPFLGTPAELDVAGFPRLSLEIERSAGFDRDVLLAALRARIPSLVGCLVSAREKAAPHEDRLTLMLVSSGRQSFRAARLSSGRAEAFGFGCFTHALRDLRVPGPHTARAWVTVRLEMP